MNRGSRVAPHRKRVGLVLGGGGARGAAHLGVLEVLLKAGIQPEFVSGTSAGSVVGALYAAGVPVERALEVAAILNWSRLGQFTRPSLGFFDITRMEVYLNELMGGNLTFDQLKYPFVCLATDLRSGELYELKQGQVAPAVRASCSVPGVFTPVRMHDRLLVDGGLINNLPVAAVRRLGAEYVIAVDLLAMQADQPEPKSIVEVAMMAFSTLARSVQSEAFTADTVIRPNLGTMSLADMGRVKTAIDEGRKAAERMIDQVLQDLGLKE